nr:uncharacterized protein LOC117690942 isoform X2 [Crassostrea gigas]
MMDNRIRMFLRLIIVVLIFHVQQSKSIYCQGIVDSVKIVTSCPESKAEWDYAARRKDCSIIASKQDCSSGLQFEYHCVINEYRSKLLEVCAPRRLIFGYCVEFNVAGGVIQRHWSAPCNETFPKCDTFYFSTKAYLYPDCYRLISKSKTISTTTTTTTESTSTNKSFSYTSITLIFVASSLFTFMCVIAFERRNQLARKLASLVKNNRHNIDRESTETEIFMPIDDGQYNRHNIDRDATEIFMLIDHGQCASKSRRNGPDDLQPHSEQGHDASDNQSGKLSTVQSDSAQGKDASDNQSEELSSVQSDSAPSSIQSASSGSTFYEDAFEGRSNDPDDLQPNSEQGHDASDNQSGKLSTVQSVSDQGHDASDNQSEELSTVQSDSDNICDPGSTRSLSPAPSSIQSASSGSTIFEDASEGRGNDPDDLQPHSEQGHDASDSQSEELSTMQSDSEKTFSCSEVKDMLP